jgi:flagellar export protein FliJ
MPRFSLDVLLRFRRGQERQAELTLQRTNRAVAALERGLDQINKQIETDAERELQQMQLGLNAAELHFQVLCRSALRTRRQAIESELRKARESQETAALSLRLARQQRELLDALLQKQQQAYRQQAERQNQRSLDDLYLMRRAYRPLG